MIINGYDYHFAYTVRAHLEIKEMRLSNRRDEVSGIKRILFMAVVMSNEYEKRLNKKNPKHKIHTIGTEDLMLLDASDLEQLSNEVNAAYLEGTKLTVETEKKEQSEDRQA